MEIENGVHGSGAKYQIVTPRRVVWVEAVLRAKSAIERAKERFYRSDGDIGIASDTEKAVKGAIGYLDIGNRFSA